MTEANHYQAQREALRGERRSRSQQRMGMPLAEKLGHAAWAALNHDNDWDGKEEWNVANRKLVIEAMTKVLREHRGKRHTSD